MEGPPERDNVTERLYYHDSRLLEFEARIVSVAREGERYAITLDRSAFYPTSGGQLHDTGAINGIPVVEVIEVGDEVVHFTATAPGSVGESVHGVVDATRRRQHCRQHTAQHILSQAFFRLFGKMTVSVHLGEEYGAVELGDDELDWPQCEQAEDLANRIVAENRPITTGFYTDAELQGLPLRKPPARTGKVRVVTIKDYECTGCGGTHCASTAEVGVIKLVGLERLRRHTLVKFLCGQQVLADYSVRWRATDSLSRRMTCHPRDLPARVDQLEQKLRSVQRELVQLHRDRLPSLAIAIASRRPTGRMVVGEQVDLPDDKLVTELVKLTAAAAEAPALLLHEGRLFLAVPDGGRFDAGDLARRLAAAGQLRGGGNKSLANLGPADPQNLSAYLDQLEKIIGDV